MSAPDFDALVREAEELLALCRAPHVMLATAESCTGGLIAAVLTEVPGSSDVFERGFVTYSNAAKNEMLGVPAELIERVRRRERARRAGHGDRARSSIRAQSSPSR